jgi:MFS family permease
VDLRLFRQLRFRASARTQFLANAIAYGGPLLLPLYFVMVRHASPTEAGMLMAPAGLGMLVSYPMTGRLVERFGPRRVAVAGAGLALAGTLPFVLLAPAALPLWGMRAAVFVRGAGLGGVSLPSIASAYIGLPREEIPAATTAINIVQRLGGPMAVTVLTVFLHARLGAAAPAVAGPFRATFLLLCAVHFAVLLAAFRLPVRLVAQPG